MNNTCENTDRWIFVQPDGPRIHITKEGDLGINVGGLVFVRPIEEWHRLAGRTLQLRDRYGWPVERTKGRYVQNFIRMLIHTNIRRTWLQRNDYRPNIRPGDLR